MLATVILTMTMLGSSSVAAKIKVTMLLLAEPFDMLYFVTVVARAIKSTWLGIATLLVLTKC